MRRYGHHHLMVGLRNRRSGESGWVSECGWGNESGWESDRMSDGGEGSLGKKTGCGSGGGLVSHFVAEGKVNSVEVEEEEKEEEKEEQVGEQGVSPAWPRPRQGEILIA